ncbi:MAG: alpha/beta hydrolase [Oleiphilaceae bacterium]|uniref:alpha/beta hydrolase n=1 Tax=Oleiphilus sp. HI0125 TaxID=1822266 RepID=UPI0007C34908|nr:alpha/beta hydrolase [Oleiphilus sp. HI0125]KZZ58314.1 hypothetical protein A3762_08025 [Oleiphilus sp. HI0125]MCH2158620.1 alpha/beta hydrolase [Oleiphilaceae bacterium]
MYDMSFPPVVIIHGMWSTGDTLSELKRTFESEGYETHTPDLPFHIPKDSHTSTTKAQLATTSIRDYVEFVTSYIDELDEVPILVGHSMGGLIAQLVAQEKKIHRLVLLSSAAPAGINGWSLSVIRSFGHNLFKFPLWKKTTELTLRNVQYGIANTQTERTQEDIFTLSTLESGQASTEIGMWFVLSNPPTKVDPTKIDCPILILSGKEDRITPPALQLKIKSLFQNKATLQLMEGVCHWTIGGTNLPLVQAHIFNWLGQQRC